MDERIEAAVDSALYRSETQQRTKHEAWQLQRQADFTLRQARDLGDPLTVLTPEETSALLKWMEDRENG